MTHATFRFGTFRLDTAAYQLTKDGQALDLPPKVIDLLALLISQPASLVTKDAILARLWPDVAVTDNAITQVVSELRQALGDDSAAPTFVQTVPRRGYRFIAEVQEISPPLSESAPAATMVKRRRTIAVSDFQNVNHGQDVGWLASGIARRESISALAVALFGLGVSPLVGFVLGLVLGIAGLIGDLAESLIKRGAGVKDASEMVPGHGGFLDRLDSVLLTTPLVYYYVIWVVQ